MFGMKAIFKKDEIIKIDNNDSFIIFLLQHINQTKENTSLNTDINSYEYIFNQGLASLKDFILSSGDDRESFSKSLKYLIQASELESNKTGPYYYLSCLFHLFNQNTTALNYLRTLEAIDLEYNGLTELKNNITKTFLLIKN